MSVILSLSLSGPSAWAFPGLEPGRHPGNSSPDSEQAWLARALRPNVITGPRHMARARDGDGTTLDSDGHAHPPRDRVALLLGHTKNL